MMMWGWNSKQIDEGKLQRIENEIFRALEANEAEIETAAASPFLYRRLRVRIEAETRRRAETGKQWLTWLTAARQATPTLALVALLAVGVFWTFTEKAATGHLGANQPTTELPTVVSLFNDEVLAALVGLEKQELNTGENAAAGSTSRKGQ